MKHPVEDLFVCSVEWYKNEMKLKMRLKEDLLKETTFKAPGIPYTSANREYFVHHLGEKLGDEAFAFRRQFFNIEKLFNYMKDKSLLTNEQIATYQEKLHNDHEKLCKNVSVGLRASDVYKQWVISTREDRKKASSIRSKKNWADPEKREHFKNTIHSPEANAKRVQSFKRTLQNVERKRMYDEAMRNPERIVKITKARHRTGIIVEVDGSKMNMFEAKIAFALNKRGLKWEYERPIHDSNDVFFPDFFVPEKNLLIEANGLYWHAHPSLGFADNHEIVKGRTVHSIRESDKKKIQVYEKLGYKTLVVWQNEIDRIDEILENV